MAHVQRMRNEEINYAAVSTVIALHLWDKGLKPDTDADLPRRLRDRVRQADADYAADRSITHTKGKTEALAHLDSLKRK